MGTRCAYFAVLASGSADFADLAIQMRLYRRPDCGFAEFIVLDAGFDCYILVMVAVFVYPAAFVEHSFVFGAVFDHLAVLGSGRVYRACCGFALTSPLTALASSAAPSTVHRLCADCFLRCIADCSFLNRVTDRSIVHHASWATFSTISPS